MVHATSAHPPRRVLALLASLACAVGAVGASTAVAASPPANGPIAYSRFEGDDAHLMLVEPDGSGTREVPLPQPGFLANWSTDGRRIALTTFTDDTLSPMIVDVATGAATIVHVPDADPDLALLCRAWSPDDERLLCQGDSISAANPGILGVYSLRTDGSGLTRLTTGAFPAVFTDKGTCGGGDMPGGWSPDGTQFVFTRARCGSGPVPDRNQSAALFVANADGSDAHQIVPYGIPWSHEEGLARWSPEGDHILFGGAHGNLFTVDPDGGHLHQIALEVSGSRSFAIGPDWSPDGSRIVFNLFRDEGSGIYTADTDGHDLVLLAAQGPDFVNEPDWGAAVP